MKDPYVLEFTGIRQDERFLEADLERSLIEKLQQFLLELGKGFAFMGRQQRIVLDGRNFYREGSASSANSSKSTIQNG